MSQRTHSFLPWVVWCTAVALYIGAIINRSSLAALGPAAQHHFGIDAAVLALFPVLQLIVYAACQIPVGVLLDRYGMSLLLVWGAILMGLGQLALATVSEVWLAVLARVLVGAGDACTFISVMRLLPEWFSPRQLPLLGQLTGLLGQIGQLVSVTPLALLVAKFGWSSGFLAVAALGLLLTVLALFVLRDVPASRTIWEQLVGSGGRHSANFRHVLKRGLAGALHPRRSRGDSMLQRIRHLLRISGVRLAFWLHFSTPFSAHSFMLLWGTPFLVGGMGYSSALAGGLLSLTVVAAMFSGLLLGPLTSRFAHYRVQLAIAVTALVGLCWVTLLLWPGVPPFGLILVLLVLLPLGGQSSMIAFDVARAHTPPGYVGLSSGIVNTGGFIAAFCVVMLIGVALDLLGAGSPANYSLPAFKVAFSLQIPFWVLGITMMCLELRRSRRA